MSIYYSNYILIYIKDDIPSSDLDNGAGNLYFKDLFIHVKFMHTLLLRLGHSFLELVSCSLFLVNRCIIIIMYTLFRRLIDFPVITPTHFYSLLPLLMWFTISRLVCFLLVSFIDHPDFKCLYPLIQVLILDSTVLLVHNIS